MTCVRLLNSKPALAQARDLVHLVFEENPLFTPDNKFVAWPVRGHMHGNLRALVGAADYALYVKDPALFGRIDALYRYVRSQGTRFGFLPEVVGRKGDVISCETCALMDFVGLGVTLANNGHPEYWGDVERMVRNQLLENQVADASWAENGDSCFSRNGPPGASHKRSIPLFRPTPTSLPGMTWAGGWSAATPAGCRRRTFWRRKSTFPGAAPSCGASHGRFRTAAAARARTPSSLPGRTRRGSTAARSGSKCTSTSSCRRPRCAAISRTRVL